MKTFEQVQQELNTYLNKTSEHVFVKTINDKKSIFRVFNAKTKDGKTYWMGILLNEDLTPNRINIQFNIDGWSSSNAKNNIKHLMFLEQGYMSVRLKRKTQPIIDSLKEIVSLMDAPDVSWRVMEQYKKDVIEKLLVA
jgi:oligoribonuclease NrnB/cAMP/cGMP phosphodiesterase (DHH superfamily)|tara:strand:- start:8164 stop:8577 length:414 start_codon:yes stop_codon:yes gene_type:complete